MHRTLRSGPGTLPEAGERPGRRGQPARPVGRRALAGFGYDVSAPGRHGAGSGRRVDGIGLAAFAADSARLASEASFAALCGVSPVEQSSGKTQRRRLNRGGNRQANAARYRIVTTRLRRDDRTRIYLERRTKQGMSKREIIRCSQTLRRPRDLPPDPSGIRLCRLAFGRLTRHRGILNTHLTAGMRRYIADGDWLTFCQLPPYAPDLNPTEGIWSVLRRTTTANPRAGSPCLRGATRPMRVVEVGVSRLVSQGPPVGGRPGCLSGAVQKFPSSSGARR